MTHPIYTVGYNAGWSPAQLRDEVLRLGAVLWDIRAYPHSRRREWEQAALVDLFGRGFYRHEPALGNLNYANGGPITLANPVLAVPRARDLLRRQPLVLLCACRTVAHCHRADAADYLSRHLGGVPVVHLLPPVPTADLLALSLNPPWGTLIAVAARFPALGKRIETRDWQRSHRGPLAIHQTRGLGDEFADEAELAACCRHEPFATALAAVGIIDAWQLPRGKIVAVTDLVDVCATSGPRRLDGSTAPAAWVQQLSAVERAFGNYEPGRFGWHLDQIRALPEPVPCRGTQGLWPVPADVAALIAAQLAAVVQ